MALPHIPDQLLGFWQVAAYRAMIALYYA